jgi:transposase
MRGLESPQQSMFSYVSLGRRVPQQHPLRAIRKLVCAALVQMHGALTVMYSRAGRPSIPPERLIPALLLQIFSSVRSERQLMEQLDYNLLFRWFVGLEVDDAVWDASSFAKNRDRLVDPEAGRSLLAAVIAQARANRSGIRRTLQRRLCHAPQEGQNPRRLQPNATSLWWPQSPQR